MVSLAPSGMPPRVRFPHAIKKHWGCLSISVQSLCVTFLAPFGMPSLVRFPHAIKKHRGCPSINVYPAAFGFLLARKGLRQ